ncbi:hypothetical protein [Niabella beijingensis]|uniref:hypothetical protein n=1 Tax=Niabella beijingensis TaxID=2872700 RepID=UPI001CC0E236|nr:hypothetical protein [Niabella beijingensis]MBZ4189371.1 hypothetical protein [Niabella beijingensis]
MQRRIPRNTTPAYPEKIESFEVTAGVVLSFTFFAFSGIIPAKGLLVSEKMTPGTGSSGWIQPFTPMQRYLDKVDQIYTRNPKLRDSVSAKEQENKRSLELLLEASRKAKEAEKLKSGPARFSKELSARNWILFVS